MLALSLCLLLAAVYHPPFETAIEGLFAQARQDSQAFSRKGAPDSREQERRARGFAVFTSLVNLGAPLVSPEKTSAVPGSRPAKDASPHLLFAWYASSYL